MVLIVVKWSEISCDGTLGLLYNLTSLRERERGGRGRDDFPSDTCKCSKQQSTERYVKPKGPAILTFIYRQTDQHQKRRQTDPCKTRRDIHTKVLKIPKHPQKHKESRKRPAFRFHGHIPPFLRQIPTFPRMTARKLSRKMFRLSVGRRRFLWRFSILRRRLRSLWNRIIAFAAGKSTR